MWFDIPDPITWHRLEDLLCRVLGVIHATMGAVVFIGGIRRFPPPTYQPLVDATNGQVWPYGALWLTAGLLMMFAHTRWLQITGLFISICITNLWAALFAVAAFQYDNAGLTASVAYGGYGLISGLLFGFMVVHWALKRRRGG